jgi:GTPase SAR1 family protein
MPEPSVVIAFPPQFPQVTTGLFLAEQNALITGHINGSVYYWDILAKTNLELCSCPLPVRALACSNNNEVAIGCEAGTLAVFNIEQKTLTTIQEPDFSKHSRVWRTAWLGNDVLVMTSTYGIVKYYVRQGDKWKVGGYPQGHSNSVFGAATSDGKFLVTADWSGTVLIWQHNSGVLSRIQRLNVNGNIRDIFWYKENSIAAITQSGRVLLFEKEQVDVDQWRNMYEIETATGSGNSIHIMSDGETVFAGTENELIQFDFSSQLTAQLPLREIKKIFSIGQTVYLLTNNGFFEFKKNDVEVREDLINYKFAKVSLLGRTGTGKSTIGNYIISGEISDVQSTFGKRIWNWPLPKENGVDRRVIISDYGGQEAVLETFLPFIKDSDIFLIFYKQVDRTSFEKALRILKLLSNKVKSESTIIFVQTFIDHEMNEIPEQQIIELKQKGAIKTVIKVSATKKIGLEEFRKELLDSISWKNSRIMIRSPFMDDMTKALAYVQQKEYSSVNYWKFKKICEEATGQAIGDAHLKFLLKDYANQGIIEYYPEILKDTIIFNEVKYNKLLTNIPIYAENNSGVVAITALRTYFDNSPYIDVIDEVYTKSKIAIKNGNLRIFPEQLPTKPLEIPSQYVAALKEVLQNNLKLPFQDIETSRLIDALSEINLQCIGLTQKEGIFAWEDKAFIYYSFAEAGSAITGRYIACTFYIGGAAEKIQMRLKQEFSSIVEKLYGILEPPTNEREQEIKKKLI